MIRSLGAFVSCLAAVLAGLGVASSATAAPPADDSEPKPSCVYTLSTPEVVQVSSATLVRVTLEPYPCMGSINPNYINVCLRADGTANNGKCGFSSLPIAAEVFLPYRPGTTYVATGTGCGSVYTDEQSICSSVGPERTTL